MTVKKRMFWQSALFCAILLGVVVPAGAAPISKFAQLYYGSDDNIAVGAALTSPVLNLDNQTLDVNLTGSNYDFGFGVFFNPTIEESSGTIVMKNGSSLNLFHDNDSTILYGIRMANFAHAEVLLDQASTVSVTTMAPGESLSASAYGLHAISSDLDLTLDHGSQITAETTSYQQAGGVYGVYAQSDGAGELNIRLDHQSKIEAKKHLTGGSGVVYGLQLHNAAAADITIANNSIVHATGIASAGSMYVDPTALSIYNINDVTVTLDSGSQLISTQMADNGSPFPYAYGLRISSANSAEVSLLGNSRITVSSSAIGDSSNTTKSWGLILGGVGGFELTLAGNSRIDVTATSDGTGVNSATAYGVQISIVETANIALTDGSKIIARAQTTGNGEALSYGLYNDDSFNATLTLDATSAISADYAVYDSGGNTTIHNSGLLAGRLDVAAINNSSSGVLQATFGSGDGHAYPGGIDDFYFFANTAELAAGSTFRINPTDNLGLNAVGDTASYALLQTVGGNWNQADLQLTSTFNSSLFGLNWHADSDNNQLIATATFLSPEQVGLSGNATRAFEAAMADGLFTFASDPTAWVPDVSGAFLAGMNQSLANSQVNIGNRLGGLMGLNSGDDVTADNGMWFSARYTDADQDRRHGIDGFSADTTAFSIGFDREFHNVVLGLAYTHGNTDAKTDDHRSKFDMDDNLFSLYGSYDALKWYGEAVLSAGFGNVNGKRLNGSQV